MLFSLGNLALYLIAIALPIAILIRRLLIAGTVSKPEPARPKEKEKEESRTSSSATIMQAERTDLAPAKDDPFTQEELKAFDGKDPGKPVYVAIKGLSCPLPSIPDSIPCSLYPFFAPAFLTSGMPEHWQAPYSMCRGSVTRTALAVHMRSSLARTRRAR